MIKRFVSVILVLMLTGCSAGCGRNDRDKYEYTDIRTEAPKYADMHIYSPGYGTGGQPRDKAEIDNMLAEVAKNISDTINATPFFHWIPYEQYDEEIMKLIQSGEKIDAFTCFSPIAYVQQDLLLDITDLFPRYAPKYYHELTENEIGRDYLYYGSVDGKLYLMPYYGFNNPRYCIVTRKDYVEKYAPGGFETMEDYGEFLKMIYENEKGVLPGDVNARYFFTAYMEGNGYYIEFSDYFLSRFDEPENIYAMEQTSEFVNAWRLLSQWHAAGYIKREGYSNTLLNGRLASELMPMNNIENVLGQLSVVDAQFTVIPLYMGSKFLINTSGRGLVITKTCSIPERVVSFVEWIHESQENYDLFRYGVKDRNYSLQGDRVTFPRSVKPLTTWFAADYFFDIRYERLTPNLDADLKELYQDASFKNTVTLRQLYGRYDDKAEENPEAFEELMREYDQIAGMIEAYNANMEKFLTAADEGNFNISPGELAQMQKESGVEQILSLYRKAKQFMTGP
ncbi:MAG: extracellular solute-binding protein [Clostridiaceae bacterium]|nr:extracellular solute-binding protein [Clostridiaceae bacterium]